MALTAGKRAALAASKLDHIDEQIRELQRNERIAHRVGGIVRMNMDDEVGFQQTRRQLMAWAQTASDAELATKRAALVATLPAGAINCLRGDMRGLDQATVLTLAQIELLDIAAGTTPNLPRRV